MSTRVLINPDSFRPVIQTSIHADNKVGRLNEILGLLKAHDIHLIGLSILDTTDSSIIRIIVDYPEEAQHLLEANKFSFVSSELVAVEINIHYIYPFISRPNGRSALAISLEDNDLANDTLSRHQITVIGQNDITR